ncbi:MAG: DUF368 domain-containing protein, partial [bacterium]
MCMGLADVIPGVSGGTMALILGIYEELVQSIRNLDLRFLEKLKQFVSCFDTGILFEEYRRLNVQFFIFLGIGILLAIGLGSLFVPQLLANYPALVRSLFFGLILASVWIPLRQVEWNSGMGTTVSFLCLIVFSVAGLVVSSPQPLFFPDTKYRSIESQGESLSHLMKRGPSAEPAFQVFWNENNDPLRRYVKKKSPEQFNNLRLQWKQYSGQKIVEKREIKARNAPYERITVPEDMNIYVPVLSPYYLVAAGSLAICAMILPGISGSYILLILGGYFFVLNLIKGSIKGLLEGSVFWNHLGMLALFGTGAVVGIVVFSR